MHSAWAPGGLASGGAGGRGRAASLGRLIPLAVFAGTGALHFGAMGATGAEIT